MASGMGVPASLRDAPLCKPFRARPFRASHFVQAISCKPFRASHFVQAISCKPFRAGHFVPAPCIGGRAWRFSARPHQLDKDVEAKDEDGQTPLLKAADNGHKAILLPLYLSRTGSVHRPRIAPAAFLVNKLSGA
jgi:hypothetical protein